MSAKRSEQLWSKEKALRGTDADDNTADLDSGELVVNYGSMMTPHRLDFF